MDGNSNIGEGRGACFTGFGYISAFGDHLGVGVCVLVGGVVFSDVAGGAFVSFCEVLDCD